MLKIFQASAEHEPRTSRCTSWIYEKQKKEIKLLTSYWNIEKAREFQKNILFCFSDYDKVFV